MGVYVGTAGFDYKDWNGIVYPPEVKKLERLSFLAQYFDCCEINSSFYGPIRRNSAKEWCRAVSDNQRFLFPVKLYRAFTHIQGKKIPEPFDLKVNPEEEKLTREGLDALMEESKLGAVLIQFPVSFRNEDDTRSYLFSLVQKFKEYPLVVEIRHDSWNDSDLLARLAEEGVGFCNIDQPRIGGLTGTKHITSHIGYVRLHGRNAHDWFRKDASVRERYDYLYTPQQLQPWADKIKQIAETTEKTFAVTNNHNLGKAAVNALEIENLLTGQKVQAPAALVERYRQLKDIAV